MADIPTYKSEGRMNRQSDGSGEWVRLNAAANMIPTNWLDPLLTGRDKVIGEPPYTGEDIENLLRAIRKRLEPQKSPIAAHKEKS